MRIGIAMFYHESHSFVPYKTDFSNFQDYGYYELQDVTQAFQDTKTELGGFIDVLKENSSIEIVPIICAAAIPSGVVTMEAYQLLHRKIFELLQHVGPLDGLLLALHGAMVVENEQDPELRLLEQIREIYPHLPIATTLDMHANIQEVYVDVTPLHVGYKTYPHIDMYETGVQAAKLLLKMLEGQKFITGIKKLAYLPPSINMRTAEGPMAKLVERGLYWEQQQGIVSVTILGGFPYADVTHAGASLIVIGHNEQVIQIALEDLNALFDEVKEEFIMPLPTPVEAIQIALNSLQRAPVVLADISDNPLSCGSGDTTTLIREVLPYLPKETLIGGIYDLESIERCKKAGIGQNVTIQLGGKIMPEFGDPITMNVKVIAISDGVFYNSGPYQQNYKMDLKSAVHVKYGEIDILLVGRPMSANDPEMFRHIGIEPANKKILIFKAKNHFRAAFDEIVGKVIYVDAPGPASNNLNNFTYEHIPTTIWPLSDATNVEVKL